MCLPRYTKCSWKTTYMYLIVIKQHPLSFTLYFFPTRQCSQRRKLHYHLNRNCTGISNGMFDDTKWAIRICKENDRQHNGQMKQYEETDNGLQNTIQKTKD